MFENTFMALLPAIIAIALALITKEAYSSLFIGVVLGALLLTGFNLVETLELVLGDGESGMGLVGAIYSNGGLFIFFVVLGAIVSLMTKSGGSKAFGLWAEKNIKTKVGAVLAAFILGVLIFIDDYFNCLTVGSVMRPVTDTHKISRVKLAYIIDATAAPVCMIAPISSWAAAVSGVASDLNSGVSGISLFIKAIPFNFYSILTFVFIIGLTLMKFDYGKMKEFEIKANSGDLSALEEKDEFSITGKGKVIDMLIPVIVLIVLCVIFMIKVGGFFDPSSECYGNFLDSFGNTDAFIALPLAGIITLIFSIIYMISRKLRSFKEAMSSVESGFIGMVPAMIILTLAVSLKSMTNALGAADFVSSIMESASGSLYSFLPAVVFLVACFLAFASGTSWGTFGILIPIVTAIFSVDSPLLIVGISACLAGAVCGDHCSPISDTTIMASAGAKCNHVEHVSTQLPYAITVAAVSFIMYLIAGFIPNPFVCLPIGAVLVISVLFVIKRMGKVTN